MDRFKGLRLLVVDDNKLNNQTLKQLLELSGASVSTAENGFEALESLQNSAKPFHLIMMDVNMPKLDGLETTRIIRQDKENSTIPIIALTADCGPQDQWQCFQAGMDAHIAKPLDYEILCTSIANLLDSKHNQIDICADSLHDPSEVETKQEILRRFANNSDLVVQMIPLYQQEFQELLTKLEYEQSNSTDTLHALKGLASTLGANDVVRKVINLSDLIKSERISKLTFDDAKAGLIQSQLNCLKQLKKLFGFSHDSEQLHSDSLCLTKDQKQHLINLLQMSDLSVIAKIEQLKNLHPENKFVFELCECINHLNFNQAISLLKLDTSSQISRSKSAD